MGLGSSLGTWRSSVPSRLKHNPWEIIFLIPDNTNASWTKVTPHIALGPVPISISPIQDTTHLSALIITLCPHKIHTRFMLLNSCHSPPPHPAVIYSGLVLTGLTHAVPSTVSSYVELPCYVQKTLFSCGHLLPLVLPVFSPHLPQPFLCLWGRRYLCYFKAYTFLRGLFSTSWLLWVSVLISIYWK